MKLLVQDWLKPVEVKELKQFALTMSWALPLFFAVIIPWLFNFNWQYWPLYISAALLVFYVIRPTWLIVPYKFWMTVGGAIGWVNTRLILGLCFYILITPLGLILRLFGKLQYRNGALKPKTSALKNESPCASNYVMVEAKSDKQNLENPF